MSPCNGRELVAGHESAPETLNASESNHSAKFGHSCDEERLHWIDCDSGTGYEWREGYCVDCGRCVVVSRYTRTPYSETGDDPLTCIRRVLGDKK